MRTTRIVIVGAGVSGLYAAWVLQRQGVLDYLVLEARGIPGGRIASFDAVTDASSPNKDLDRFDLGPTWFWPDYQSDLSQLIDDLGLKPFAQHETGDMMAERTASEAPMRVPGYASVPPSMRLLGGMGALIDALQRELSPGRIVTGEAVLRLRRMERRIELESENAAGEVTSWQAEQVLLAVPPRLIARGMTFSPPLPASVISEWRETATWMAPHAKYIAVYEEPFWREQSLSGEGRSTVGPLGEIHDASMPGGHAVLFGFFGVPATVRQRVSADVLREHCRAQFARLFGPQAAAPAADTIKDWAFDPFTATEDDLRDSGEYPHPPAPAAASDPWQHCLIGIASEWSPQFPGYVAGAIEAARLGVQRLIARTASYSDP